MVHELPVAGKTKLNGRKKIFDGKAWSQERECYEKARSYERECLDGKQDHRRESVSIVSRIVAGKIIEHPRGIAKHPWKAR